MKIKIDKIKKFFKKLPWILGKNFFLASICFIILSLILGSFLFYRYNILDKKVELQITEKPLQFDEKTYQDILKIWQEREERLNEADLREYLNPFR